MFLDYIIAINGIKKNIHKLKVPTLLIYLFIK